MLAFEGVTTVSEGNKAREVGSLTSCEVRLIIYRVVPMWSWYQLKKNLQFRATTSSCGNQHWRKGKTGMVVPTNVTSIVGT